METTILIIIAAISLAFNVWKTFKYKGGRNK